MEYKKSRNYLGVIYPDSETYQYMDVISAIKTVFSDFAYIVHDHDVDENGELKKTHIHWLGRFGSPRYLNSVAKDLGLNDNDVQYCKNFERSVCYLIHLNSPNKYQYKKEDVCSNFDIGQYLRKDNDELTQSKELFAYIVESGCTSMTDLTSYALQNDLWSTLRRGSSIFVALLNENRQRQRVPNYLQQD